VLGLDTLEAYEFDNFEISGLGRIDQKLLGTIVGYGTLCDFETANHEDRVPAGAIAIDAYIEFKTNFGTDALKRLRRILSNMPNFDVTVTDDDGNTVNIADLGNAYDNRSMPRTQRSRIYKVKLERAANAVMTKNELRTLRMLIHPFGRKGVN
jgi:hypothetical protein